MRLPLCGKQSNQTLVNKKASKGNVVRSSQAQLDLGLGGGGGGVGLVWVLWLVRVAKGQFAGPNHGREGLVTQRLRLSDQEGRQLGEGEITATT